MFPMMKTRIEQGRKNNEHLLYQRQDQKHADRWQRPRSQPKIRPDVYDHKRFQGGRKTRNRAEEWPKALEMHEMHVSDTEQ